MVILVRISDGNPEIGALVKSEIGNLICSRHFFFRSTAFPNLSSKKTCLPVRNGFQVTI